MKFLLNPKLCRAWKNKKRKQKTCCSNPQFVYYVIQERSGDEMPTAYKECKTCKRKFKA